jgi:hypothetical protein
VGKAYFALLDVLCHNHANVIATRDTGARHGMGRRHCTARHGMAWHGLVDAVCRST